MDTVFFIAFGTLSRVIPHLPNMTPVGSLGLFISAKYSFRKALISLFAIMLVSDIVLGFHPVMRATYGSFFLTALLGRMLQKKEGWKQIGIVTIFSSLQFFLLTNFAVWLEGMLYPKTLAGLLDCYFMALPFFRNSLLGDLFYTTIFFGAWEMRKQYRYMKKNACRIS